MSRLALAALLTFATTSAAFGQSVRRDAVVRGDEWHRDVGGCVFYAPESQQIGCLEHVPQPHGVDSVLVIRSGAGTELERFVLYRGPTVALLESAVDREAVARANASLALRHFRYGHRLDARDVDRLGHDRVRFRVAGRDTELQLPPASTGSCCPGWELVGVWAFPDQDRLLVNVAAACTWQSGDPRRACFARAAGTRRPHQELLVRTLSGGIPPGVARVVRPPRVGHWPASCERLRRCMMDMTADNQRSRDSSREALEAMDRMLRAADDQLREQIEHACAEAMRSYRGASSKLPRSCQ